MIRVIILALLLIGVSAAAKAWLAQAPVSAPVGGSCAASLTSSASGADTMTASATVANALTCQ